MCEEDYETTDDGHGMREEDSEGWKVLLRVRKPEDSSSERISKKSRLEVSQETPNADRDTITGQSLLVSPSSDPPVPSAEGPSPHELMISEEESATPIRCKMMDLFTRSLSDTINGDLSTIHFSDLCFKCTICNVMRKVRVRQLNQGNLIVPAEGKFTEALRFWARVDRFASTLYWTASQVDGDTMYLLIQMLHREAMTDHAYMRKCNTRFRIADFENPEDLPHFNEPGKVLSPIQAEELRLNKALICTASHYTELAFESKSRKKLEALDIMDNILKSLRILWLAELNCRKAVLDDDLP